MHQYVVDNSREAANSQRLLLALPLAIIMVFCFGFVAMVHPAKEKSEVSASTGSSDSAKAANQLPPISVSDTPTAKTLDSIQEPATANQISNTPSGAPATGTPQQAAPSQAPPQTVADYKSKKNQPVYKVVKSTTGFLNNNRY